MKTQKKSKSTSIRQAAASAGLSPSAVHRKMRENPRLTAPQAAQTVKTERRSLQESRESLADTRAKLAELELAEREGRLINKDTVDMQKHAFVQIVQSGIMSMHTTLAMLCLGKTQSECETEIKGYARRMIEGWKKLARHVG
jgi:hypothetical protein